MQRLIHLGLLITFLLCYLEWGQDNSGFLFQLEYSVISAGNKSLSSIVHPLILLPFAGQVILLIAVFLRNPNRRLVNVSILLLSVLVLVILLVGILVFELKIILSTLPFLMLSVYYIFFYKKSHGPKQIIN
ncbi:MAG TPA: hypothetical protein VI603_13010 [Saprospiraceae bacterium]|nr:hypothetical protein [Saprospiraceae bacterium]